LKKKQTQKMDFQRYEYARDIVSRHDIAQYPVVFAFIADWAKVDTDMAVKAFYDNHCDIVNACLHLELCTNTAAAAPVAKSKSKPMKWLAAKLKRLFCCGCFKSDSDDINSGAWSVTCTSTPIYWEEGDFSEVD